MLEKLSDDCGGGVERMAAANANATTAGAWPAIPARHNDDEEETSAVAGLVSFVVSARSGQPLSLAALCGVKGASCLFFFFEN